MSTPSGPTFDVDRIKPSSILHTLAEHFHLDARVFATRFDALWEHGALMHKDGRIKSFTDLLFACECTLKAHLVLTNPSLSVRDAYGAVRQGGHNIERLACKAGYLQDRSPYEHLSRELSKLPIDIRYSVSSSELFFPDFVERENAAWNYSATIGNEQWVKSIRDTVETLISEINHEFTGLVTLDFEEGILQAEELRQVISRR